MRGIVRSLSVEYTKKARGTLRARCDCEIPASGLKQDVTVEARISDADGDDVAVVHVHWRVGPKPA